MKESEYDLKKSFQLRALPIPIIEDQKGNVIDGFHRRLLGLECPVVQVPIKNPRETHLIRLLVNACRRAMSAEEKSQALAAIVEGYGYNASQIAELLPFSYDWVCKYLPKQYKHKEMAELGAKGGKASSGPHDKQTESVGTLAGKLESDKEFAKRFTGTVQAHVAQLMKKDFPVIVSHMSDRSRCDECTMKEACTSFLELLELQEQLPACMRGKLQNQLL